MRVVLFSILVWLLGGARVEAQMFNNVHLSRLNTEDKQASHRAKNIRDIERLKEQGVLVDLPSFTGMDIRVRGKNNKVRLVATPELVFSLNVISERLSLKKPVCISSTLRPEDQQRKLRQDRIRSRRKGRKVTRPADPKVSKHPSGMAADLTLCDRNAREFSRDRKILRNILSSEMARGHIRFKEERNPHHFHIETKVSSVPSFVPYPFYFEFPTISLRPDLANDKKVYALRK